MYRFILKIALTMLVVGNINSNNLFAQYTVIGSKLQGGTANNGPMLADDTANRYSRFAYIYPVATLGNLKHGDTIRSLEFFKDNFNTMKGNANFKLFIGNSAAADFGAGSLDWKAESQLSRIKKVYDNNPTGLIPNKPGYVRFEFENNGFYVFDTTGGKINLEILTEFTCDSAQTGVITWAFENNFTVGAFISPNESKWKRGTGALVDYTNISSINKPHLKINYFKNQNDLEVRDIYCLGTIPVLMGIADTIKAIVKNVGLSTQYQSKCFLQIRGSNFFNDSLVIDSIKPHEERFIYFTKHLPDTLGKETITIVLGNDNDTSNNTRVFERNVNYNVYSHIAPYKSMSPGGIGFNGTSGDFVARFFSDSARYINQMKVEFGFGGRNFQFGIWDASGPGGTPGKNLFTSDTLMSTPGNYILPVLPRVKVEKTFFAGIRQTGTLNVAFAYQLEDPIRPGVFYFTAPMNDTNWTSFSPGYNFNFNIQPRLQVGDDIAVWQINKPSDMDTFDYNQRDTFFPEATFINYGFNDQSTPFPVVYQIRDIRSLLVYSDTQYITLKSEDTLKIKFNKGFSLNNFGQFRVSVFSFHGNDKVIDNNQLESNFWIVVRNDIAADNIFEPINGIDYELNEDSIWPIARVINYGANTQSNVPVTFRFRKDSTILYQRTKFVTLSGGNSQILAFDTFAVKTEGKIWAEVFTTLARDSFPSNDTTRISINVVKSKDCGVTAFLRPTANSIQERGVVFRPYVDVQNFGIKNQDTVPVIFEIKRLNGTLLYRDSVRSTIGALSKTQALFQNFNTPDTIETLRAIAYTKLNKDQLVKNDTLLILFDLYHGHDLAIIENAYPTEGQRFKAPSDTLVFKTKIVNNGLKKIAETVDFYCVVKQNNQTVFSDTVSRVLNLNYKDTLLVSSNKTFVSDITGKYEVTWYHQKTVDQNRGNDAMYSTFFVTRDIDLALDSILIPAALSAIEYKKDTLYPMVTFRNNGANVYNTSAKVTLQITLDAKEIYNQSIQTDTLEGGQVQPLQFAVPFYHSLNGQARVLAYITSVDPFAENDTLKHLVHLAKSHDITCIAEQFPKRDSVYRKGDVFAPKVWVRNDGDVDQTTLFSVSCMVYLNGNLVYTHNKSISLLAKTTDLFAFDSSLSFGTTGKGEAVFFSLLGKDQERNNDTLKIPFFVTGGVGIEENGLTSLSIYPNPAQNEVTLHADAVILNWELVDISGKSLLQKVVNEKITTCHLSHVMDGLYYIKITTTKGMIIKKLVIAH